MTTVGTTTPTRKAPSTYYVITSLRRKGALTQYSSLRRKYARRGANAQDAFRRKYARWSANAQDSGMLTRKTAAPCGARMQIHKTWALTRKTAGFEKYALRAGI